NVVKGLEQMKGMGDDLQILYRNGLELHGYADTGNYESALNNMVRSKNKVISIAGKLLNASANFTFNVVHPGIKTNTSMHVFDDLRTQAETTVGRALNTDELNNIAKKAVDYTDKLFSGEDIKGQLLRTNEWMAKYWYSPEARKTWEMSLLSPTWQKEHLGMFKDVIKSLSTQSGKPEAYLYRRYLYGALSIYASSNLYNFVMTKHMDGEGKLMIQNPDAFSVRMPWNENDGRATYMRPLKSIFEVPELMSDVIGTLIHDKAPMKIISKVNPTIKSGLEAYTDIRDKKPFHKVLLNATENAVFPISGSMIGGKEPLASQVFSTIGAPVYGAPKPRSNRKVRGRR
ncbi:MAG: hypothetical protein ACYDBX_04340, partial [Patescibacteria group bacterium]